MVPVGTGSVSDVVLFPLSYTAQAVFGIDKRNQEDYVLRLPTQSFDQRPGSIRRATLILPLYLLLVPVLFSASLLTSSLSVWGIIEPCGTAVRLSSSKLSKVRGRQIKRLWNTREIKKLIYQRQQTYCWRCAALLRLSFCTLRVSFSSFESSV